MYFLIFFFAALCIGVSVTVFGTMIGEDRTWMPEPDNDRPGWSFGVTVVAGFFAAFSFISMLVYTLVRKWELLPKDYYDGVKRVDMKPKV